MDGIFEKLAGEIPSLVVMAIMVGWFLRHLTSRDKLFKTMSDDCHRVQREGSRVIQELAVTQAELLTYLKRANDKNK